MPVARLNGVETRDVKLGTLLVVYHRAFWRRADGSLWEREGAFSRYLESLAPHFERVLLAAPETYPEPDGHRVSAANVALAPLPFFDSLARFVCVLPGVLARLWHALGQADIVNLRVPTPAAVWAFALARARRRPIFLLVVGDLAGVAASIPADTLKRRVFHGYLRLQDRLLQAMVEHSLTITNGSALYRKHARPGCPIFETRNSTVRLEDVGCPREPYRPPRARLLCISRIDPRKGLRYLPAALDVLRERGIDPTIDILGPTVGRLGEEEKARTLAGARRLGLEQAVCFRGAASLERVRTAYGQHDLLLVPSLPGEGIPRVLLEAMAAGLPLVATSVAGIPDLVEDGRNGLLVPAADGKALGLAAARLLEDSELRARCVAGGYATARENSAEAQAARLAKLLREHYGVSSLSSLERPETRDQRPEIGRPPARITIPLAGLNLSGGVKSLLLLANRLAERGATVRVLVPDYAAGAPIPLDPAIDVRVLRTVGPAPLRKPTYYIRLAWEAAAGAEVVLANYYLTVYPALASWLLHRGRARLAYNVRGYEPWSHGLMAPVDQLGRLLRFILAWLTYRLPLVKLVTTDWLRRMTADPGAVVVGHGIDLDTFRPGRRMPRIEALHGARATPLVVGAIGRLGAVKGYPDFLAAARSLPRDRPFRFLIARADPVPLPEGSAAESVEARTEADMAAFYNRCDVFVFPSLAEGFGLPALEAMACGCAVITTDCGGVSAFARPGENCLMVPAGQPRALAEAMLRLTCEPELRARLASAGLATAQSFDRSAAIDRLAEAVVALAARN
jgi:glycosyltransferase involved in cell wall biosynthesis